MTVKKPAYDISRPGLAIPLHSSSKDFCKVKKGVNIIGKLSYFQLTLTYIPIQCQMRDCMGGQVSMQ